MTEIMPVPRNSHITVLRPPSITSCPFFRKGRSKWIFEMRAMMRTRGRKPPNRPSGRRRGCAVRAFCPRQNLGAGAALPPRALKSRRVEPPCGRRNPQKRTSALQMSFFVVREAGVEPARPCEHWHLKPASLPIPPLAQVGLFLCIVQNE